MEEFNIKTTETKIGTKNVKIGFIGVMTGPYAATGAQVFAAFNDYMKYINEEQGGIDGVKIEFLWVDAGAKVPEAVSAYKRFKEKGIVQINCSSSVETSALSAMVKEDKIPMISTSASKTYFSADSWNYCQYTTSIDDMTTALKWIHESDWDYETRARAPRIAFLGWDSAFGRDPVPATTRYAGELGMDVVADEYFSYGALDVTPQLKRIKAGGADYVFITALNGGQSVPIKDGARIGLWDQAMAVFCHGAVGGLPLCGEAANDIMLATGTLALATEDSLGKEIYQKYHPDGNWAIDVNLYSCGVNHAMASVEGLRLALEKVGFDNLDGTAVKEQGLDRIESFDTSGVSGGISFTYDPMWHVGGHKIRMIKVVDAETSKVVMISDWIDVPIPSIKP